VLSVRWLRLGALLVGALLTASCGGGGGSSPQTAPPPPPPPPGIVLVPASLAFSGVGAGNASTVKVSETGNSGDFTVNTSSSSCLNGSSTTAKPAGKVAVAPPDHGTLFTVTPTQAGACGIVLSDDSGHSATLQVQIAITAVGGS
jgi:hypothetical protein